MSLAMKWQRNHMGDHPKMPTGEFVVDYFSKGPIRYALVRWECGLGWKDMQGHSRDAPSYILILEPPPEVEV